MRGGRRVLVCPFLEEANERGLVARSSGTDGEVLIAVSAAGSEWLRENRPGRFITRPQASFESSR